MMNPWAEHDIRSLIQREIQDKANDYELRQTNDKISNLKRDNTELRTEIDDLCYRLQQLERRVQELAELVPNP